MVATGAPDSSNWPPGSSEIAPPPVTSEQADDVRALHDRLPAEQVLHALEQRADAARPVIGNRLVAREREGEFFVLGADAKLARRLVSRRRTTRRVRHAFRSASYRFDHEP